MAFTIRFDGSRNDPFVSFIRQQARAEGWTGIQGFKEFAKITYKATLRSGIYDPRGIYSTILDKMPMPKRVAKIDPANPGVTVNSTLARDLFGDHPGWSMTSVLADRLSITLYDIRLLDHPLITAGIMANKFNVVYGWSRGPMFTTIAWDKNNV